MVENFTDEKVSMVLGDYENKKNYLNTHKPQVSEN